MDDGTLHSGVAAISSFDTPLQWWHRLGHPFLQKLRQVLPIEFSFTTLECESYQLEKHYRASYSSRINNMRSSLFYLI